MCQINTSTIALTQLMAVGLTTCRFSPAFDINRNTENRLNVLEWSVSCSKTSLWNQELTAFEGLSFNFDKMENANLCLKRY